MKNLYKLSALSLGLVLSACGGGGGSSSGGAGSAGTTVSAMTVTPSLGKFNLGTSVRLKKPDNTVISTGNIGTDGSAILNLNGYTGPIIVEVLGSSTSKYFDEGTGLEEPFGVAETLSAALAAPQNSVGVTSLTNAAVTKLKAATGGIAAATTNNINDANAKVAKAFNLPDVLTPPTPVGSTTGPKLSIAAPADKYALVLAALAKTAGTGKKATDVSTALAADLKDDKLDQQDASNGAPVAVPNAPTTVAIANQYTLAASTFADSTSQTSITTTPLVVVADVSAVVSTQTGTDVTKAKALFADLRTTIQSLSKADKSGFLDTQAQKASNDANANVGPNMERVFARLNALGHAKKMFEDASAYTSTNTMGLAVGSTPPVLNGDPVNNGSALTRQFGTWEGIWFGNSSGFQYCWTGSETGLGGKVTCVAANSASIVNKVFNNGSTTATVRMLAYEITQNNTTGKYSYTAKRYNMPLTLQNGSVNPSGLPTLVTDVPSGAGTFDSTTTSAGQQFILDGTMPPSGTDSFGNVVTTVDTLYLYGTTDAAAIGAASGTTRYTIKGSVSTADMNDSTKTVQLSIDTGTYVDVEEVNSTPTSKRVVVAKLIGTVATANNSFTGTFDLKNWANYANANNWHPTGVVFTGSIKDNASGGAGEYLVGKIEGTETDFASFNSNSPSSASNFTKGKVTFTGTIKAPTRPVLTVVLAVERTGFATKTATISYSYGTSSITGSGTANDDNPSSNTMTVSNQDGVQYVTKTGLVSKSGTTLATIVNSNVNYVDGTSESLQ